MFEGVAAATATPTASKAKQEAGSTIGSILV